MSRAAFILPLLLGACLSAFACVPTGETDRSGSNCDDSDCTSSCPRGGLFNLPGTGTGLVSPVILADLYRNPLLRFSVNRSGDNLQHFVESRGASNREQATTVTALLDHHYLPARAHTSYYCYAVCKHSLLDHHYLLARTHSLPSASQGVL
jgi:hypothetical protein